LGKLISADKSFFARIQDLRDYFRFADQSGVALFNQHKRVSRYLSGENSDKRGENYLLERRMFRSLRTGEVIDERWLRFSYPTFWHYDVLRGLDYLRNAERKPHPPPR
jgi:hypothetical protein